MLKLKNVVANVEIKKCCWALLLILAANVEEENVVKLYSCYLLLMLKVENVDIYKNDIFIIWPDKGLKIVLLWIQNVTNLIMGHFKTVVTTFKKEYLS